MVALFIGDVVGTSGCEVLLKGLPKIKKRYSADIVVVNGENSADGNGIHPKSAEDIFAAGADVITGGNHTFRRPEFISYLDEKEFVLRPDNFPPGTPGKGLCIVDKGSYKAAIINLMGVVYMQALDCPFRAADRLIEEAKKENCNFIFVDFHAEATSEKKALGYYLDGKVSGVFGTHTHVQTADEIVLPNGTAYISDLGMTGPIDSILGVKKDLAIASLIKKTPIRFENAEGTASIQGVAVECDKKTGKTISIERFQIIP